VRTVQGEIERALTLIIREPIRTAAAGRTDQGVHASGQVVSFEASRPLDPRRLIEGIQGICKGEIRVRRCDEAPSDFHARHRAIWREYRYRLCERPSALWRGLAWQGPPLPALPLLRASTEPLLGRHDFTGFANASPEIVDPVCHLIDARWDCWEEGFLFTIRADRFLYKMVRTIVATLLREAGPPGGGHARIAEILAARLRSLAAPPAPACGLVLAAVGYDPPWPQPASGRPARDRSDGSG
jgi:tRNA pseudouridine38-40 synthase